jgi:hypothetical protein
MSDISDVLVVLGKQIAAVCYPTLTYDEISQNWDDGKLWDAANQKSLTGRDILIYPGKAHISIFPKAEERNTTRYGEREIVTVAPAPTITFSSTYLVRIAGRYDASLAVWDSTGLWDTDSHAVVTIGGTVTTPQNLALRINGKLYVYSVKTSDTLTLIAAAFAALINPIIPGTSSAGAVLTIGSGGNLQAARAGGFGTVAKEVRRQERVIQISIWCSTPDDRDAIAGPVDAALAQIRFLTMPDGFAARLTYKNSMVIDAQQKADLYRRDLNYTVEYATTVSEQVAAVIAPSVTVNHTFTETY